MLLFALILGGSAIHFVSTTWSADPKAIDKKREEAAGLGSFSALGPAGIVAASASPSPDRSSESPYTNPAFEMNDMDDPALSDASDAKGVTSMSIPKEHRTPEPSNSKGQEQLDPQDRSVGLIASLGSSKVMSREGDPTSSNAPPGPERLPAGMNRNAASSMDLHWDGPSILSSRAVVLDRTTTIADPLRPIQLPNYVLCPSEWWLGIHFGSYSLSYDWAGENAFLANALNEVEAPTSTLALGLSVGKEWRSGWGLSTGLTFERSEQAFSRVERTTQVEEEFTTYVVTLNTQVFVIDVDSSMVILTTEKESNGAVRRSHVRIPLETYWHKGLGRWSVGPRAGLALEFVTGKSGTLLMPNATDGSLVAARPDKAVFDQRFPTTLVGTIGLDIGVDLDERWTIQLKPGYMQGLLTFQGTAPAESLPHRWGVQFGIVHHFMKECSK